MLIPNKFNGYVAARRIYPASGGSDGSGAGGGVSSGGPDYGSAAPNMRAQRIASYNDGENGNVGGGGLGGMNTPFTPMNPTATPATPWQAYPSTWNNNGVSFNQANQMVSNAYGQIGRAGIGSAPSQVDREGYDYWMGQLNKGALSPQDFAGSFQSSATSVDPSLANRYQNQALSQISGARPSSNSPQFFQPVYQTQYDNYASTNPLGVSQYNTPMTAQSMVDSAYAGIGRYGMGNNPNQIDPAGRQYWMNDLNSGRLAPQDFTNSFNTAVQRYNQSNPNDPYAQYTSRQMGYSGGYQGYAPSVNPYQMNTPFNQYGGGMATPFNSNYGSNVFYAPISNAMRADTSAGPVPQNLGPSQAIVSRSARARSTPPVMSGTGAGISGLLGR